MSSNADAGPSFSSSSHALEPSVQQVEAEQSEQLHAEPQQHEPQPSSSERRGHQSWRPRQILRRFLVPVPSLGCNHMTTDVWSCTIIILTFWLFASMILILGFYGSYNSTLGPNCSYAIGANPLLVQSIKVQAVADQTTGPMLYGFHKSPSLDVETTWSQSYTAYVEPDYHKEWTYYLNSGSQVIVQYDVKFPVSYPISLVIAQGRETLVEWIDNPTYPDTTLSWNMVNGSGEISQDITESDTYYVAVGNLNVGTMQVFVNITIRSLIYNTTNAVFKCALSNHKLCNFKLILFKTNVAVITTPSDSTQVAADNDWYFEVSYGPQWFTYCIGSCIVTVMILALMRYCNQPSSTYNGGNRARGNGNERDPLLSPKSDDDSSMGSSYESGSNDDEDGKDNTAEGSLEGGKVPKDGNNSNARHLLCAICFDAPKDCFFVPCGHSATCFSCGLRIAEQAGTCPICRRKMKKVRKIFSV